MRDLWIAEWQRLCCNNSPVLYLRVSSPRNVFQDSSGYISTAVTSAHHSVVTKESWAKRWGFGTQAAAQTLQVTTQKGIHNAVRPIHRRFRTKQMQLKYVQLGTQH